MTRALPRLLPRVRAGLRWARRQVDGEDRWQAHLDRCARHGHPAGSRAEFERRRADAKAAVPGGRCC